jgi:hypothetical protein
MEHFDFRLSFVMEISTFEKKTEVELYRTHLQPDSITCPSPPPQLRENLS